MEKNIFSNVRINLNLKFIVNDSDYYEIIDGDNYYKNESLIGLIYDLGYDIEDFIATNRGEALLNKELEESKKKSDSVN